MNFIFCEFYRYVNADESHTNWIKPKEFYGNFINDSPGLHIDKLHKNSIIFLQVELSHVYAGNVECFSLSVFL